MNTQQQQVAHHDGSESVAGKTMSSTSKKDQGSRSEPNQESAPATRQRTIFLIVGIALLIGFALAIAIPLSNRSNDATTTTAPDSIDFTSGLSLITHYSVDATITSRLVQTRITMEVSNALDCPSVHSTSILIPRGARVASLQTISKIGNTEKECVTTGKVKKLADRETSLEYAAEGLPGAYVEEQIVASTSSYSLQVSIPPLGQTRVELILEELLSINCISRRHDKFIK